jgi:predicted metal-dependent HD superfamily phosphohydrolase
MRGQPIARPHGSHGTSLWRSVNGSPVLPSHDECLVEAELRARAANAGPHRRYHDERHLDDCLQQLDRVHDLAEHERRLLRWAILWHDVVYEPGAFNNEELSAKRAQHELIGCGVDSRDAAEVARLIRLTKSHKADESDRLGALLVSIDLSILGADPARYASYAAAVREEYAHVPDPMWQTGRGEVLKRLLSADPLYPDPGFRAELEERARRNMEEEIRCLGGD